MQIVVEGAPPAVIQIAALEQTFYDGEMVCGAVVGHRRTFADEPVSELCADIVNSVILVKYRHPIEDRPTLIGRFCVADVTIVED